MNWRNIRVYNNSQNNAFEELVCQLARQEKSNGYKKFIRNGTPDGDVECFWQLENGKEYVWQAKYVFDTPLSISLLQISANKCDFPVPASPYINISGLLYTFGVGFVLSVRSDNMDEVIPSNVLHTGFEECVDEACDNFWRI